MAEPTTKTTRGDVDGTPEKRMFLSIISDYNIQTALFELIDNALDLWVENGKPSGTEIDVSLDSTRQLIIVRDNAGGIPPDELRLLISPGASRTRPDHELIGVFGVGGKRAAVALGERVEIRTRRDYGESTQLDITADWLTTDDWNIPTYTIPHIEPNSTIVEISKLRQHLTESDIGEISKNISETYSEFILDGCNIKISKKSISSKRFNNWAFPPDHPPVLSKFNIHPTDNSTISVEISAGLILDRIKEDDNYGVYLYCNGRLIAKELKTRDVGYHVRGEAGVPHPDASLCRVIIEMRGPADAMPWNSSKSGINFAHPAFVQIRPKLIELVSHFSSLSRRLQGHWDDAVFKHTTGSPTILPAEEILSNRRIVLPNLPRIRARPSIQRFKDANKSIIDKNPWTLGLIESMSLLEVIEKQKLQTGNRVALILIDSNLEIAMKEYIANSPKTFKPFKYNDTFLLNLFKNRTNVLSEIQPHAKISAVHIKKMNYYYALRNKLVHERATVGVTDDQISDFRQTAEYVLKKLFKLSF